MILKGTHLLVIMILFIGFVGGLVIFLYRYKFLVANRLGKDLGFTSYLGSQNIPAQYTQLGEKILEFKHFEWLLGGEINGKKVYVGQYFLNRPTLYMYRFVLFSPFEQPITDLNEHEGDFLITQNGVFFYHGVPWTLKNETILPLLKKIVEVHARFEK